MANEGFLRGQGILNLESVQEFYKIIGQQPSATMKVANLFNFCNKPGFNNDLDHIPVLTLVKINSETGDVQG